MNAIAAYTMLIIGLPNYIGAVAGAALVPVAWKFSYPARTSITQLLNLPKGVLSALAAYGMFSLLRVTPHWAVLVILVAWVSAYYWSYRQPRLGWASFVTGQIAGWIGCLILWR